MTRWTSDQDGEYMSIPQLKPLAKMQKPIRRKLSVRVEAGKRSSTYINVVHTEDPKQVLFDKIGHIPEGVVQFSRILVAIYQPPSVDKTDKGVFLTQKLSADDAEEALWQGKVGMVVSTGPQAYVDDETTKFHGTKVEVGDWVWFRPSDGVMCEINETPCRVLTERDIIGKLPHPDMVW